MKEIIEKLISCAKKGTPILLKPQEAEELLFALGYRL